MLRGWIRRARGLAAVIANARDNATSPIRSCVGRLVAGGRFVRVAVIANKGDSDDGFVGERLLDHGAELRSYPREEPGALEALEQQVDLLVLLGSDWSVYDESFKESIRAERDLVVRAQAADIPILGICFGGQQISNALGLKVSRSLVPEIGWKMIRSEDESQVSSGPWFQYHFDRWSDANGVSSVAYSPSGPQALWYGRSFALQFHPEVTLETIVRWCEEGRGSLDRIGVDFDRVIQDSRTYLPDARERCFALVDRFLESSRARRYPKVSEVGR